MDRRRGVRTYAAPPSTAIYRLGRASQRDLLPGHHKSAEGEDTIVLCREATTRVSEQASPRTSGA